MMTSKIGHTALVWTFDDIDNFRHAVQKCGELGFRGTEIAGNLYDQMAPNKADVRALLDASDVTLAAMFQFGDWTEPGVAPEMVDTAKRWADAIAEIGGSILVVVPGHRERDHYGTEDFKVMADTMNKCGAAALAAGITAAVHPHWGTTVETEAEIDLLLSLLDGGLVGFAPDSGQIAKGGGDPVAVIKRHITRVRHVHLKDLSKDWPRLRDEGVPLNSPKGYAELGEGTVDLDGFLQVLDDANFTGWLLAELDESRYTPDRSAEINRDFLWKRFGPSKVPGGH
jgi:inosose dehydratase